MRGASVRGARRLTSADVLDGTLSTKSKGNEVVARAYRVLRPSGSEKCGLVSRTESFFDGDGIVRRQLDVLGAGTVAGK